MVDRAAIPALVMNMIIVICAQHILLLINMSKKPIEYRTRHESNNRWRTQIPREVWIFNQARENEADGIGDTCGEQVEGGDKTTHVLRCTRVGEAVSWHIDEELGDTAERVGDSHPPDADGGDEGDVLCINT